MATILGLLDWWERCKIATRIADALELRSDSESCGFESQSLFGNALINMLIENVVVVVIIMWSCKVLHAARVLKLSKVFLKKEPFIKIILARFYPSFTHFLNKSRSKFIAMTLSQKTFVLRHCSQQSPFCTFCPLDLRINDLRTETFELNWTIEE